MRPEVQLPPNYCQYNSGPCDQDFTKYTASGPLVLYSSDPPQIAATIDAAVGLSGDATDPWRSWRDLPIHGQIIFTEICKAIRFAPSVVADVTTLNFNLLFEIGFAVGLGVPVIPIRDTSYEKDQAIFEELGILQTLGYVDFTNVENLLEHVQENLPAQPLPPFSQRIFTEAPLYVLKDPVNTEGTVQLMSNIKKSRIKFRTYDPVEIPTLPLGEARRQVSGSIGVIAHLLDRNRKDSREHNALCALVCGMAMAQQKVVVMLQEGNQQQPIDYRDVVQRYEMPNQIKKFLEKPIPQIVERMQAVRLRDINPPARNLLDQIDLGDVAAENEILALESYFYRTGQFNQARQGHARLVVGRKGTGKSAIFYEIRNPLLGSASRLVLDLKPEGHQFTRLHEFVLERMTSGLQEHTMMAFWHYLLLAEMARKILLREWAFAQRDGQKLERYRAVEDAYGDHEPDLDADFSQRLLREVNLIASRLEGTSLEEMGAKLTELLFTGDVPRLERAVGDYLLDKEAVWLLIDNLDKGWPTHGASDSHILIVRSLLEATRKLQHRLEERGIPFRCLVFLRSDIHEHLLRETPDKGKDTAIDLDWMDESVFEEIVRLRVEASTELDGSFSEIWAQICESHIEVQDTFNYLLERTLKRPRDLLLFLRRCIEVATNNKRAKIQVEDILLAEKSYSEEMLFMLAYEIQDTRPEYSDILYSFHGQTRILSKQGVSDLLRKNSVSDDAIDEVTELLMRFGFLGVTGAGKSEDDLYYHTVRSNIRRLLHPIETGQASFVVHPAFREALQIQN